jgi:acetyltransferase
MPASSSTTPPSANGDRYAHMSIYPYPVHLIQEWQMNDGKVVTIRPIRPEDADMEQEFVKNMSDESRYYRFMDTLRELTQTMLVRFTQIDYDREMALVATVAAERGQRGSIERARKSRSASPATWSIRTANRSSSRWPSATTGRSAASAAS